MFPLYMLVYTSTAAQPVTTEILGQILSESYRWNRREQITGLLISRSNHFLQLLEGPKSAVKDCFARIARDPRHKGIQVRGECFIQQRLMAKWSMGLVDEAKSSVHSKNLFKRFDQIQNELSKQDPLVLIEMMTEFAQNAVIMDLDEEAEL